MALPRGAEGLSESGNVVVRNPATGEEISRHVMLDAAALRDVIRQARAAQPAWNALPLRERVAHVAHMRDWLAHNADNVATIVSRCTGKTVFEALAFDVMPSVFGNAWYCRHARRHLRSETLPGGSVLMLNKKSFLSRKPFGVIGIISPWNYPLGIPMHEIVPALLAGNTVVFKTAPETVPVGELVAAMCAAAGLPAHVFNHVVVDGPLCGDVMLDAGGIDKLFFTGSVRVGKLLAEKAAKRLLPLSLELGGKDAMLVLDDANIERAAHGAVWGGMQNCGQSCAGVERVYVQRSAYDAFVAAVKCRVDCLNVNEDIGVLTTARQVETVRAHLQDARERGAEAYAPHARNYSGSPQYLPPTVLTGVNHDMRVMREETFGPVIGIMPFDTDEEAVALANDSPYALTASVWSRDSKRAQMIAGRIEAGAVMVNDHLVSHGMTETPWGGPKDSGLGRGHGRFAFEEVTQAQVIIQDRLGFLPKNLWWYPNTAADLRAVRGAIALFFGHGLRTRLRGLRDLLARLPKMLRRD